MCVVIVQQQLVLQPKRYGMISRLRFLCGLSKCNTNCDHSFLLFNILCRIWPTDSSCSTQDHELLSIVRLVFGVSGRGCILNLRAESTALQALFLLPFAICFTNRIIESAPDIIIILGHVPPHTLSCLRTCNILCVSKILLRQWRHQAGRISAKSLPL